MNDKLVAIIQNTAKKLTAPNQKSVVAARKALTKYAKAHPEEFVASGLNIAEFPHSRRDVRKYGCLGEVISVETANEPEVEMRAAHEYYNMLATAVIPLISTYRKTMEGPKQREGLRLTKQIDECYNKVSELCQQANFERIKKINLAAVEEAEPKITILRDEITALKSKRSKLLTDIFDEMRTLRRGKTKKLVKIENQIYNEIKKIQHQRPVDLWHGNYNRVEKEFKQAIKVVKDSPFYNKSLLHFRYERRDGTAPANLMTYVAWNGEGTLTTPLSNIGNQQTRLALKKVATVMNGSNTRFRLRRLQQKELSRFGLPEDFLQAAGSERLHVASIRNTPGWYETVVVLHRPLAENMEDEVLEASLIRKKIGFKHITELHVIMKRVTSKSPSGQGILTITPTFIKLPDGTIQYCTWTHGDKSGVETLPSDIKSGLNQVRDLDRYIKEHYNKAHDFIAALGENVLPEGLSIDSRKQMHHSYKTWCYQICPVTATSNQKEEFKSSLRELRAFARQRHGSFNIAGGTNGGAYGDNYIATIAFMTEKVMQAFGLKKTPASAFAALVAFDERYAHLFPWASNLSSKILRRRHNIYCNFASKLGRLAAVISVPDVDYTTRHMTEEQKVVSPSELVNVLTNYADREGLRFTKFEIEELKVQKAAAGK
jgi:hypothetical protein